MIDSNRKNKIGLMPQDYSLYIYNILIYYYYIIITTTTSLQPLVDSLSSYYLYYRHRLSPQECFFLYLCLLLCESQTTTEAKYDSYQNSTTL